jgi:hypothetical protein
LQSLVSQTRRPDAILVIDDASGAPPREIVAEFPGVTLWTTAVQCGPERILQSVMQTTDFDAYMVQDADDWSAAERLEDLLALAEQTGAELLSGQEMRVTPGVAEIQLRVLPLDVNRALERELGHSVSHSGSLIGRALAKRIGGFDPELRVTADTDFALRAAHAGRVANLASFCLFRRMRPGSLTSSPETGFGSAVRVAERDFLFARAEGFARMARPEVAVQNGAPEAMQPVSGPALPSLREDAW